MDRCAGKEPGVKSKKAVLSILAFILVLSSQAAVAEEYQHAETRELVAFVRKAAALVAKKGEACFPLFKQPESGWLDGDRYVFVLDTDGNRYVYPPDPDNERINIFEQNDLNGRPFGSIFTRPVAAPRTEGWAHYLWTKPNDAHPTWKTTFLIRTKAPSGKHYIVGSGGYTMRMEKTFIVAMVDDAAAMLQEKGSQGFDLLRDKRGDYYFKDTYVFVTSFKGREFVNPAFPMLEGRNVINTIDAKGKAFVRAYIKALQDKDSAWVTYRWPKPGETIPSKKRVYVKKVVIDGEPCVVGSGVYSDWLKSRQQ
jgi:signal transduction histidine kinase